MSTFSEVLMMSAKLWSLFPKIKTRLLSAESDGHVKHLELSSTTFFGVSSAITPRKIQF